MAYAALVSLSQTIEKLLHDQDHMHDSIALNGKLQVITSTHEHIMALQCFLEDFPQKAIRLEGRIRDAANEAEDILESFMLEHTRQHHTSKSTAAHESVTGRVQYSDEFRKFNELSKEIGSMAVEVMEIKNTGAVQDMQLSDHSCVATSSSSSSSRTGIVIAPTNQDSHSMVGFDDDLMAIKGRLCAESSKLRIIPIFGMGGVGKTTLARNAYDDPLIVEYFHIRAWVTVSQDYSAQQVLSRLVVSIKPFNEVREQRGDSMEDVIYKSLKGRRYLIVMDDMWSTEAWDDVRRIFPDDHNGSRILLTTRLSYVAAYPDSLSPVHEMHFINADQSWNLLQKKLFKQGNCPCELEDIGKAIARSCRGLPLAIVVIAGVLSTVSQTRAAWENIARNVNEAFTRNDEKFVEIVLSSSYDHLPHHLRACFLYLGSFPEDYEIHVSKLIKLWVAEGFLKLPSGSKTCEEVAEEYLEDLVRRSLVLVTKRKSNGKIKCCSVHDLVRDMCIKKAHQEKFLIHVTDSKSLQESIRNPRRVSIAHSGPNCLKNICGSHIHTILCFTSNGCNWGAIGNIGLLRVLAVVDENFHKFEHSFRIPRPIIKLFHLRYLALPYYVKIPAAIKQLQNLQTLIIHPESDWWSFLLGQPLYSIRLPREVWRMRQLRHLVSCSFDCLPDPVGANFALENLQTLSGVKNFRCTREILQMIPNLKKLGISYFQDECVGDCQLENLEYLRRLEKLKLEIKGNLKSFHQNFSPVFPTNLKKLTLCGWKLPWEKMGIVGSLPNLEVLKLINFACSGYIWETSEGEFRQLKFLLINESNLCDWMTESSHFPSLSA